MLIQSTQTLLLERTHFENSLRIELFYSTTNKINPIVNKLKNSVILHLIIFTIPFCSPKCPSLDNEFSLASAIKSVVIY